MARKILWALFAIAMIGGFYFTPAPLPGESVAHYVFADNDPWQVWACSVVASVAGMLLFLTHANAED